MSRCKTLEEYLEEFTEENTQSSRDQELQLRVTDQQARSLGNFFINGLAGFGERRRLERAQRNQVQEAEAREPFAQDDATKFIN